MTRRDELYQLAYDVRRLHPSRHDPEHYFIEKDRIEKKLKRLAQLADREGWGSGARHV